MSKEDCGRWKLVSMALTALNSKPAGSQHGIIRGRMDEDVGSGRTGDNGSRAEAYRVFESTHRGGADGNDTA